MTPLEREIALANMRERAIAFCDYATKNGAGVRLRDPEYREVVENRDPGPKYSSCGDLAHALLEHLGARAPWVNRASVNGRFAWGMNVNRLARPPVGNGSRCPLARAMRAGEQLQTGDIAVVWKEGGNANDAHVFVVDTHGPETLTSWDYGQGAMSEESWKRAPNQIEGTHKSRRIVGQVPIQLAPGSSVVVPLLDMGGGSVKPIQSVVTLADLFGWMHPLEVQ